MVAWQSYCWLWWKNCWKSCEQAKPLLKTFFYLQLRSNHHLNYQEYCLDCQKLSESQADNYSQRTRNKKHNRKMHAFKWSIAWFHEWLFYCNERHHMWRIGPNSWNFCFRHHFDEFGFIALNWRYWCALTCSGYHMQHFVI